MPDRDRKAKNRQNTLLLITSILVALAVAEAVVRISQPVNPAAFRNRADINDVGPNSIHGVPILGESNSMGLRENREYGPYFIGYRVLAVGDSFTYGYKLLNENSWPKLTEQLLKQKGVGEFQVLNGGRPGTDTRWQADFFRDHTSAYNPDMVVIGFIINDCTNLCSHCGAVKAKVQLDEFMEQELGVFHSSLLRQIQLILLKRRLSRETVAEFERPYLERSPELLRCEDAFRELRDLSRSAGFELVVVIIPMMYQLHDKHPFLHIHRLMLDFWEGEGITAYDLTPAFHGYRDTELWIQPTDSHPNQEAQRIIASQVAPLIRQHINN